LRVSVLASVTDVGLELQVRNLKLSIKVNTFCPMSISQITSTERVSIIVRAGDFEGTAHGWCRLLEGSLNDSIGRSAVNHDNCGHGERWSIDLLEHSNSVDSLDNES